jgi:transposase
VEQICKLNGLADELSRNHNIEVYSSDEKCGMQALQRAAPDLPAAPGHHRRRECNYIRHGTRTLLAALHVASGQVSGSVGPSRTEADFVAFIEWVFLSAEPEQKFVFIVDQLNTHKSAGLVRLAARLNGDDQPLGHKGRSGILKSMPSRMKYLQGRVLTDPRQQQQRIRYVYTPKHCSWLNVVEGWFSALQNRLLSLLSSQSVDDLADKVIEYLNYYNDKWAKGINWLKVKKKDIDRLVEKTKKLVTILGG